MYRSEVFSLMNNDIYIHLCHNFSKQDTFLLLHTPHPEATSFLFLSPWTAFYLCLNFIKIQSYSKKSYVWLLCPTKYFWDPFVLLNTLIVHSLYEYTKIPVDKFFYWWVVSSFMLCIFLYQSFCRHILSFLLRKHLGIDLIQ